MPGFYWETLLADRRAWTRSRSSSCASWMRCRRSAQLFLEVPADTWRPYFKYHYLVSMRRVLPQAFDEEVFDFYGRTLTASRSSARAGSAP